MGFKKLTVNKYPPRLWALVGPAGAGKSTFAAQMVGPLLTIDADGRFAEVAGLAGEGVYQLSDDAADNSNPEAIARILSANMPGSGVKTIVIDSLTAILQPKITQAMRDAQNGKFKNRVAAFQDKALSMRELQDAVSRWGVDVLWIYHLERAMDPNQKDQDGRPMMVTRATLPATERARLYRSLNLELHLVQEGDKRGVKVAWARRGRAGSILWDDSGCWQGMPARIEAAVYDGLSQDEQAAIEGAAPAVFPNKEAALNWAIERGAFEVIQHASNAYEKLRREHSPQNAREMAALWGPDVERRVAETQAMALVAEGAGEIPF